MHAPAKSMNQCEVLSFRGIEWMGPQSVHVAASVSVIKFFHFSNAIVLCRKGVDFLCGKTDNIVGEVIIFPDTYLVH